jgi:hypothetical protein
VCVFNGYVWLSIYILESRLDVDVG